MDKSLNKIFGNDFAIIAKITSYNMKFVSEAKKRCMEVLEFKMKCICTKICQLWAKIDKNNKKFPSLPLHYIWFLTKTKKDNCEITKI